MNHYITATAACLLLVLVGSASAQRDVPGRVSEKLINDVQESADAAALRAHRIRHADVARLAYLKVSKAREENPGSISAELLSRHSLEWFKAQVAAATSRPDAMKAASEYLDREGKADDSK